MQTAKQSTSASKPATKSKIQSSPWATLDTFLHNADIKLSKVADQAAQAVDESHLTIHLGLMELESSWKKLQTKLEKQIDTLRRLEGKAKMVSGEARLQAHLAKADVTAAAEKTRERMRMVERRLHAVKVKSEGDAAAALKRLGESCANLSRRLGDGPEDICRTAKRCEKPAARV